MLGRKVLPLFVLCSILSTQAVSQVYTWVDEKGQKHFGSQPPSQQHAEPVSINQGYVGDGRVVAPSLPAQSADAGATSGKVSKREMCQSAMRWTAVDMKNLKTMAAERMEAGRITAAEYAQGQKNFAGIEERITLQDCVTSSGEDRQRYECLSQGSGVLVCSGLAAAAMEEATEEAKKRAQKH